MKIVNLINKSLSKVGAQLIRYPDQDLKRRMNLLNHFRINKIFDIGANIGNYAVKIRKLGFKGEIISFEPLTKAYKILEEKALSDAKWKTLNFALGSRDEETFINIAGNCDSSSLLEMLPDHINSAPQSSYIGKEKIIVHKLDTIIVDYYKKGDQIFLKIDTQGFEKEVLNGSIESLSKITGIQLELSIIPLYNGGILYLEMIEFLKSNGFDLFSLENGFSNPDTGQLLQVDGIFFRNEVKTMLITLKHGL
ncbi:MAG: FkbM family methyltransferase [Bacteroidota bacterium]|nr:FkbM family methyltransferase [Bacteroidota bacterium]